MFSNSHDFYIKNLYASDDGTGGKDVVAMALLDKLANAACLGAGHQSDERYDAPKCHPETRAAVIKDIMSWVNARDSKEPIMWMSGPAGAGKSAIAQTVCEKCDEEKKLLASFFFSRTATGAGRSEGNRLVPTIACQLAVAIPEAKTIIIKNLENNSAILTSSMEIQLRKMVLEPLAHMNRKIEEARSCAAEYNNTPHVVVIDGLDECNNSSVQCRIVKMIAGIFHEGAKVDLHFLIASRPELEIRTSFESISIKTIWTRIILDQKYKPEDDIRTYLLSEFATLKREHTLQEHLLKEANWPSAENIDKLVEKSSGQFIYASTVVKYLSNPRRDPRPGLRAILDTHTMQRNSTQKESPYAPLDALYIHILQAASASIPEGSYDSFRIVFEMLLFLYKDIPQVSLRPEHLLTLTNVSIFIGIERSELELLLADLHSIVHVPGPGSEETVKFYHASFGDFLKDTSRAGKFYLSHEMSHKVLTQCCLSIMLKLEIKPGMKYDLINYVQQYSINHYFRHLRDSGFHEELLTELRSGISLRKIVDMLMKFECYQGFKSVINFSYNPIYWCPVHDSIGDICSGIVTIVEEAFLMKSYSSHAYEDMDIILALRSNVLAQFELHKLTQGLIDDRILDLHYCWLGYLFESIEHGKHLYLDSERSLFLYKTLVTNDWQQSFGRERGYYPFVLQYLVMKITPSADVDLDSFPTPRHDVWKKLILQEIERDRLMGPNSISPKNVHKCIEDLIKITTKFLEQCKNLKRLQAMKEEDTRTTKEEEAKRIQHEKMNSLRSHPMINEPTERTNLHDIHGPQVEAIAESNIQDARNSSPAELVEAGDLNWKHTVLLLISISFLFNIWVNFVG